MKNKVFQVFPVVALTLLTVTMSAQSGDYDRMPSIGLKAGANVSNVYDEQGDEFNADPKMGLAVGAFITLPITQSLGLQTEVLFSQKGYKGSGSFLGSDYSFMRTTNYIDVPLMVTLRPNQLITFMFGPQYSYLLSQNHTIENSIINLSLDEQFENENLLKNTLCVTGGLDVNFNKIVIGGRAGWDFLSNKGDGTSTTPRYKNMWLQATAGFRF